FCESSDRGRSWSRKKYLTGNTRLNEGGSYNCARISKISGGRLAIVCDKGTHDGIEAHEKFRTYIWHGDKEGKDWSEPEQLPNEGIVPDRLLELKSGRWLLGSHKMSGLTGKLEQYVIYSDDKGKTWSDRIIVASDPRYNLCEVSVIELPEDGTLAAFMRENSMLGYDCFKALSHDGGQSWEGVYNMPIPGCHRPAASFLKDGRILLTYRFVQGGKGRFQNFFAALTDTGSILAKERNTQKIRIMPLDYDRSPNPDGGYSGWVQFDDGEIYAVTYIVDDAPKAQIRGYSFYPDEFILA
ncbi:MAG: sialidase family protein, partial [Eubacteriales bacterium]|nr:sialidase family protein [Eubacteriales bacterium]